MHHVRYFDNISIISCINSESSSASSHASCSGRASTSLILSLTRCSYPFGVAEKENAINSTAFATLQRTLVHHHQSSIEQLLLTIPLVGMNCSEVHANANVFGRKGLLQRLLDFTIRYMTSRDLVQGKVTYMPIQ